MIVPLTVVQPTTAFQQYSDNPYFQENGTAYHNADMSGKNSEYGVISQSEYTIPVALQNHMYNVAVPCSNSIGCSQLPVVMRLQPSQVQATPIPIHLTQDSEFPPPNPQQHAYYNVAIPSQSVAPQLSFLMHSSQNRLSEQLPVHHAVGNNVTLSKGSKFSLNCVPTVRIAQNSQFSATQHRNLISLTATPPTTSGSLPKARIRHNLNQDIHNVSAANHGGKARRVLDIGSTVSNAEGVKPLKEPAVQQLCCGSIKGPSKSSTSSMSDLRRDSELKQQHFRDLSKDQSEKRNISSWSTKIPNNLSIRRFNGTRSYFPEEGSSPVTAMLHCGFCYSNNETEDVFRSHNSHDELGRTICPKLRQVVCSYCKATGDRAHTSGFCRSKRDVSRFL